MIHLSFVWLYRVAPNQRHKCINTIAFHTLDILQALFNLKMLQTNNRNSVKNEEKNYVDTFQLLVDHFHS